MTGNVTDPPGAGQRPRVLRLVRPANASQNKKRHPHTQTLSLEEQARVRAALRSARAMFGSWACLADALRVSEGGLHNVVWRKRTITGDLAVRLARALGKPLESLYRAPSDASTCPTCGRRT